MATVDDVILKIGDWVQNGNPTRTCINNLVRALYQFKKDIPDGRTKAARAADGQQKKT